jgi:methyl-accepting chemotaxis protein
LENKELSVFKEAKLLSAYEQPVVTNILTSVNLKLIPRLLIVILAMAVASILISHKIAGPAYRFKRSVMSIAEGDLTTKFNLRRDDEFKDLADSLGKMVSSLRERIGGILSSVNEISSGLDKLSGRASSTAEDKRLISEIKASLTALEKELSAFKLKA